MSDSTRTQKPEFLVYNTLGLRPVETVFNLDCETVTKLIREISSKEIDGIVDVTHEHDPKTGAVGWFVWFNSNSDHFVDKSTANTAIGHSITRFSQAFQNFAKKFGWNEADDDIKNGSAKVNLKAIVHNNTNKEIANRLTCIQVALNPYLITVFDGYGTMFQKETGQNAPKVCIDRKYLFKKGSGEEFHTLVGLQVKKCLLNAYKDYKKPRANRGGNFT